MRAPHVHKSRVKAEHRDSSARGSEGFVGGMVSSVRNTSLGSFKALIWLSFLTRSDMSLIRSLIVSFFVTPICVCVYVDKKKPKQAADNGGRGGTGGGPGGTTTVAGGLADDPFPQRAQTRSSMGLAPGFGNNQVQ